MSPGNILELLIILVIVLGIGAAIWRGGARNPVGTFGLDKKINELSGEVKAVKSSVGDLVDRVEKIEGDTASTDDIKRIEKAIDKLAKAQADQESRQRALADKQGEHAAISAETAASVKHIDRNLTLIMSVVVPKGMEK
jgi:peptidoglycan hydrolase CwlO-like protein